MARLSRPSPSRRPAGTGRGRGWRLAALIGALAALMGTAACNDTGAAWHDAGTPLGSSTSDGSAVLTLVPAANTRGFSPIDPVTATVTGGTLTSATLVNATGKHVKGDLNADQTSWTNA